VPVLPVGTRVPAVSGPNQHGQTVSLDQPDSAYLLVFFPYAFTGVCTGELTELRDRADRFAHAGVRLIGCATDSMFALRVYADTERLGFDLVSDHWPHGAVARAFGVFDPERGCARRGSFAVDRTGVVRWSVLSDFGVARSTDDTLTAASGLADPGTSSAQRPTRLS